MDIVNNTDVNTNNSGNDTVTTDHSVSLKNKLHTRIRQKRAESRTNINSKTNRNVLKKVKRIIKEKGTFATIMFSFSH